MHNKTFSVTGEAVVLGFFFGFCVSFLVVVLLLNQAEDGLILWVFAGSNAVLGCWLGRYATGQFVLAFAVAYGFIQWGMLKPLTALFGVTVLIVAGLLFRLFANARQFLQYRGPSRI